MDWRDVQGRWDEVISKVRQRWHRLTELDLAAAGKDRARLVERIRAAYGIHEHEAERQVEDFARGLDIDVKQPVTVNNVPPGWSLPANPAAPPMTVRDTAPIDPRRVGEGVEAPLTSSEDRAPIRAGSGPEPEAMADSHAADPLEGGQARRDERGGAGLGDQRADRGAAGIRETGLQRDTLRPDATERTSDSERLKRRATPEVASDRDVPRSAADGNR